MRVCSVLATGCLAIATLTSLSCSRSVAPPADITGRWYGKMTPVGPDASNPMVKIMADAPVRLDLDGGRFKMRLGGAPLDGTYALADKKVTLKIERIMDQPIEIMASNPMFMPVFAELKEPLVGEVQEGGKRLYFPGKKGQSGEADMDFSRQKPQQPTGPKTVQASEAPLVGEYVFDDAFESPIPSGDPSDPRTKARAAAASGMRRMMKTAELELREDNTFTLELIMRMRGTWKLSGDIVIMQVTEPKEFLGAAVQSPQFKARIFGTGLHMLNDNTGEVDFAMKRGSG